METVTKYDPAKSWRWNLDHAPSIDAPKPLAPISGDWTWCGLSVASPLGIPAGPLLNGAWLLYYASFGFDILVYKTVRTSEHPCYELPNLVPVKTSAMFQSGLRLPASERMQGSWAVSFGMPSQSPEIWQRDIESTRRALPDGKVLIVSVVGTQDSRITNAQESFEQLADDFAECARLAANCGAAGIEANFSCPNVCTSDGQLFQQPTAAGKVARAIRKQIGDLPLVLKIGHVTSREHCEELVAEVAPFVTGFAMTNSIAATVCDSDQDMFEGQPRGICGDAIREASLQQVKMFADVFSQKNLSHDIIGVGGISRVRHVREYLAAGAGSVGIATAAMLDPTLGRNLREHWTADESG